MRFCWAQYGWIGVVALLGLLSLFSGCGAKGDLFMPEEPAATERQTPAANDIPSPQ
jgi:predicted small lipoprotein YifL